MRLVRAARPGSASRTSGDRDAGRARRARAERRLEVGAEAVWRSLATIPITLGAFFASQYACRAAGLDENLAWVVALVVYVLVVRVVRGRWPLQRPE